MLAIAICPLRAPRGGCSARGEIRFRSLAAPSVDLIEEVQVTILSENHRIERKSAADELGQVISKTCRPRRSARPLSTLPLLR